MFRITLLLAILGVAHCVMWGFHHHHSGPEDDNNDSGPSYEHSYGQGFGHHWGGCGHHGCGRHRPHSHDQTWHSEYDRRFERLTDYVIHADQYSKDFCDRFTPINVQESHENSMYTLAYSIPQLDPANIAVKIKHRVLYMYARQSDSADAPTFVDVKILPATLKISEATWSYSDSQLTIVIPFDRALTVKKVKTCVDVNVDVKDVPQRSPLIFKFGTDDQTIQ